MSCAAGVGEGELGGVTRWRAWECQTQGGILSTETFNKSINKIMCVCVCVPSQSIEKGVTRASSAKNTVCVCVCVCVCVLVCVCPESAAPRRRIMQVELLLS